MVAPQFFNRRKQRKRISSKAALRNMPLPHELTGVLRFYLQRQHQELSLQYKGATLALWWSGGCHIVMNMPLS